jgi:hypothetical protein
LQSRHICRPLLSPIGATLSGNGGRGGALDRNAWVSDARFFHSQSREDRHGGSASPGFRHELCAPSPKQHHRAGDLVDPLWRLLDMTPARRGHFFPKVNYEEAERP